MKSINIWIIIVAVLAITAASVIGVIFFFSSEKQGVADNMFMCTTFDELERYAKDCNIAHEAHDNTMHLFNVEFLEQQGYCVAEFQINTNKLRQMIFYLTLDNNADASLVIENVKNMFLTTFGLTGDYVFYSLDEEMDDIGEEDFLNHKASKELRVYDGDTTWSLSWYLTEDGLSGTIKKTVLD